MGSPSTKGHSALAAALQGAYGRTPPKFGTPPQRSLSPSGAEASLRPSGQQSAYGSFDKRSFSGGQERAQPGPNEDPEVVKKHLVHLPNADSSEDLSRSRRSSPSSHDTLSGKHTARLQNTSSISEVKDEEFSSLQLQGGDVTRQVYRWADDAAANTRPGGRGKRSRSFHLSRPQPESENLDINSIKVPGGFRRNFLRTKVQSSPGDCEDGHARAGPSQQEQRQPQLFTRSFIEFLSLYGHFAGEDLEEDDEVLEPDEYFSSEDYADGDSLDDDDEDDREREPGEDSALLTPGRRGRRRKRKERSPTGQSSSLNAALLLLKSFVGTGVLFLPKAYLNGGMAFSNLVLLGVALLSYYCFILLVRARLKVEGSFGDIAGVLYGKSMRTLVLASIVLSQIGFVAAYIVFVSENLQAFISAVSHCREAFDIKWLVLIQLGLLLPFSLLRNINRLAYAALIADVFISLGLIYLYYYGISTLISNHGVSDIAYFNPHDWTLFIGTAIFTFEGIGLIIPIQESMKKPHDFPSVLAVVMIIMTVIFLSMGALSYAAYGSATRTVVILNMPQDDKLVNTVQFLYALAIFLSIPLQLFPAVRIMETELFSRSGKYNRYIKWQKNLFRFSLVVVCSAIAWGGAGDLDKFVSIVGSFACVPLVYVYPVSHAMMDVFGSKMC